MAESLTCPGCGLSVDGTTNFCARCGRDLRAQDAGAQTQTPSWIGRLVDGRYKILERLGEGGMGSVFRVEHVRMGKVMALKLLRKELLSQNALLKRFEQEARIVSKLSSSNTVNVFDFGDAEDLGLYMAMELVPGHDLAAELRKGPLPERRVVGIALQVLNALGEAHEKGIVHRDIKPANIMLVRTRKGDDFIKVLDFGIAKLAGADDEKRKNITGLSEFLGTPNYVSPEQARGQPLDARSDIYSLCAMLYELATGRPPFGGANAVAIIAQHLEQPPPRLSEVAPDLSFTATFEDIVLRGLNKDPAARFQSAEALRTALERLAASYSSPPAVPDGSLDEFVTFVGDLARRADWVAMEADVRRRQRLRTGMGLLAAVLLVGGGGWGAWQVLKPAPVRPDAPVLEEHEPNDSPSMANRILPGTAVQGHVGQRKSATNSDADFLAFVVEGGSAVRARIELAAVPNVNVAMTLYGQQGPEATYAALARVDDYPASGGPEVMDDLSLVPGRYLLKVTDERRPGEVGVLPRENVSDPYTVRVMLDAADAGAFFEVEPNNLPGDAVKRAPLHAPVVLLGHTAEGFPVREKALSGGALVQSSLWSDDVFLVEPREGAARTCVAVAPPEGVVLRLLLSDVEGVPLAGEAGQPALSEGVAVRCAALAQKLLARIDVVRGASAAAYVVAVADAQPDGLGGLVAARAAPGVPPALQSGALEQALEGAVREGLHRKGPRRSAAR